MKTQNEIMNEMYHTQTMQETIYRQKQEIDRLILENANLRIKIKAQDRKSNIIDDINAETEANLEEALQILEFLDNSDLDINGALKDELILQKNYQALMNMYKKYKEDMNNG